jgi:hypothetical protein
MNLILESAKNSVHKSKTAFCKFISANDAGITGAHQEGFYIPKNSISLMFDEPGIKGQNKDRFVSIKWQDTFETQSRFIYYGRGTRNEYRLTRFGRGFPFLRDDNVGDLFILCHIGDDYYEGYVLQSDEDIEEFFLEFNISATETNCLINRESVISTEDILLGCFMRYVASVKIDFPSSIDLATHARNCYMNSHKISESVVRGKPDENLLKWIGAEYELFKVFENDRYKELISTPFQTVTEFVNSANSILNRRKSRAGKSLEHHLSEVFRISQLKFEEQVITEENKKPDFIFPDAASYFNQGFNLKNLVFLASKTTCKDRWRQILNEADRIEEKHLFTLQQGISSNQLREMYNYNVKLVVPKPYLTSFPEEYQDRILTLNGFIEKVKSKQTSY